DANNSTDFASQEAMNYWQNVDFYVGGAEHATGHLLYARFWTQFLHDIGKSPVREPFQKLLNQGMILGEGAFHSGIDASIRIDTSDELGGSIHEDQIKIITKDKGVES